MFCLVSCAHCYNLTPLGKEYVCVLRLHDAIANEVKLAQVRTLFIFFNVLLCKCFEMPQ